jgi:hypothetical protein
MDQISRAIDARALRQELSLPDTADVKTPEFHRFVIRLSEALDFDIPNEHVARLATLSGCDAYLHDRARAPYTTGGVARSECAER